MRLNLNTLTAVRRLPLFGRSREMGELERLVDETLRGTTSVVLIDGEAGIGKTRLIEAVVERAIGSGFVTKIGGGDPLEMEVPFGVIAQALQLQPRAPDEQAASIAQLLITGSAEGNASIPATPWPSDLRFRALALLQDYIAALASSSPVLIAIEDLQWADEETTMMLNRIARTVTDSSLLIACTTRPAPMRRDTQRFISTVTARGCRIHVEPLDAGSIAALIAEATGYPPASRLKALLTKTSGNPFMIVELLRDLSERGELVVEDGRADTTRAAMHWSRVPSPMMGQLGSLPAQHQQVLRAGSVLVSFFVEELAALLEHSPAEVRATVEELLASGLYESSNGKLVFRHELLREAVYESMPHEIRRVMHAAAGSVLQQRGAPLARVAGHVAQGAAVGDRDSIRILQEAARELAAVSPGQAASILMRAIELENDSERKAALEADLLTCLLWTGKLDDVVDRARTALEASPDPTLKRAIRLRLGHALMLKSQWGDAANAFKTERAPSKKPSSEDQYLMACEALSRALSLDVDQARILAERVTEYPIHETNVVAQVLARTAVAAAAYCDGDLEAAVSGASEAFIVAQDAEADDARRWHPELHLGFFLMTADRFDEATEVLRLGREIGQRVGTTWDLPLYHWYRGVIAFATGEWNAAVQELEIGIDVAEDVQTSWELPNLYVTRARIALHRGEFDLTRRLLKKSQLLTHNREVLARLWHAWTEAALRYAEGDAEGALEVLAPIAEGLRHSRPTLLPRGFASDWVKVALATGSRDQAEAATAMAAAAASRTGITSMEAVAQHCRGLLHGDHSALLDAASLFAKASRTVAEAGALEDAATICAGENPIQAIDEYQRARAIYERLDASRDLNRVDAALRRLGVKRSRQRLPGRPSRGWESLTQAENRVVELAASGLSNPQIGQRLYVSRRTVETHLKHAFRKLEISSRVELAALWERRQSSGAS